MTEVLDRWDLSQDLAHHGVAFLLHGLIDHVVDGHFEAVQSMDEEIELLEDLLFDQQPHDDDVQRRSFELRKSLVTLRRVVLPMREVVNGLMRRDSMIVQEGMAPYFLDVYDHVLRTRVDRVSAGPGYHHHGDEPDDPGQPPQRDLQEGHQLGSDHRGAHRHHRFLRPERALPRIQHSWRVSRLEHPHRCPLNRPIRHIQT